MEILRASEDYLESMLMMKLKHGYIRSIDVAEHLGVTKPSVTYATRRLKESGHITMDKDGLITLTETGMAVAAKMLDRHKTLTAFLIALGVDAKTAEEDTLRAHKKRKLTEQERAAEIAKLEKEMREASKMLEFEYAAVLRDRIIELRGEK